METTSRSSATARPWGAAGLVTASILIASLLGGCQQERVSTSEAGTKAAPAAQTPVQRGEYLVTILACNDCHTPWKVTEHGPGPDMTRMLSGHPADFKMPPPPDLSAQPWQWAGAATNTAYAGPWGITYAANLTSDATTGIGNWTEEQFLQVFRSAKINGGSRPVMPPMPLPGYAHLPDEDLKAIFAYLRQTPPVSNLVPAYVPPAGAPPMGAPPG